ncbi:MAG: cytochrome P450 [Pirellula sp.]
MTGNLPRGPKGSWKLTWQLIQNPRKAIHGWVKDYGDPVLIHPLNGPVIITGRADLIREIFGHDPADYEPFAAGTLIPMLGEGSMLTLGGETHRRERKLVMPMFHGDRMKSYGEAMQQIALGRVSEAVAKGPVVSTLELMTSISLDVIVSVVFGSDQKDLTDRLFDASRRIVKASNPILFFSPNTHISLMGWSPWDRYLSARKRLDSLFDSIYQSRKQEVGLRDDIFTLMSQATYEDGQPIQQDHLRSELLTFLFAGHETSALAMTWAMYHLHRNPETLERLTQEFAQLPDKSPTSFLAAPYLKAVVQETLRMHPIVTEVIRKLRKQMQLGPWTIPAGYSLAPAAILAHYRPETYPEPDTFRPERFLERSFSPFEYMPFGGGHRRCIGAAFASYEIAIVLGTILSNHRWQLVETQEVVPKRRNLTMGPSSDVKIRRVASDQ